VSLKSKIEDKYILCLCEGNAENEIIEALIDNELLIFKKPNLIDGRVFKRMRVRAAEERFLLWKRRSHEGSEIITSKRNYFY